MFKEQKGGGVAGAQGPLGDSGCVQLHSDVLLKRPHLLLKVNILGILLLILRSSVAQYFRNFLLELPRKIASLVSKKKKRKK